MSSPVVLNRKNKRSTDILYQLHQARSDWLFPFRALAGTAFPSLADASGMRGAPSIRKFAAACSLFALAEITHQRPAFGIVEVHIKGKTIPVSEDAVQVTPFGTLLHFKKLGNFSRQAKVLLVAPMSGHFSTLLRETVRTMLTDHDVYLTDWHNARDVPLAEGRFGLDEYIDHLISFQRLLGPGAHMMAICQPCVPALAATALMAEDGDAAVPASLTLMAGPIDCRINPSEVNRLATARSIHWFECNLIGITPTRHAGALRSVLPGFVQLTAFMNMNLERHVGTFRRLYNDMVECEMENVGPVRNFYQEYFAVSDLHAEFFLDTVKKVFQENELPLGRLKWRGRTVEPKAIRDTALLSVEGERDDICSLGQTLAAHDLCTGMHPSMKTHYVQAGVGHYGVFSGRRWQNHVYPVVRDMIGSRPG